MESEGRRSDAFLDGNELGTCLTVHDFVPVELPLDAVVGAFAHFVTEDRIARLVGEAWDRERTWIRDGGVDAADIDLGDPSPSGVVVQLGEQRSRRDAAIMSITWTADGGWVPPLYADIELVDFGPRRTHLHVLGNSQLRSTTKLFTRRASLEHRLAVSLVRQVLTDLANLLAATNSDAITVDRHLVARRIVEPIEESGDG
jgi:hypothetical protein